MKLFIMMETMNEDMLGNLLDMDNQEKDVGMKIHGEVEMKDAVEGHAHHHVLHATANVVANLKTTVTTGQTVEMIGG